MKETEIRKHSTCNLCKNKILKNGIPIFYVVKIQNYGLDLNAIQRQSGMATMMGHAGLAQVMGPNEDMASPITDEVIITVCSECYAEKDLCIAHLNELGDQ